MGTGLRIRGATGYLPACLSAGEKATSRIGGVRGPLVTYQEQGAHSFGRLATSGVAEINITFFRNGHFLAPPFPT
jgi:hypothetical protein